jgi:hypothetical protein
MSILWRLTLWAQIKKFVWCIYSVSCWFTNYCYSFLAFTFVNVMWCVLNPLYTERYAACPCQMAEPSSVYVPSDIFGSSNWPSGIKDSQIYPSVCACLSSSPRQCQAIMFEFNRSNLSKMLHVQPTVSFYLGRMPLYPCHWFNCGTTRRMVAEMGRRMELNHPLSNLSKHQARALVGVPHSTFPTHQKLIGEPNLVLNPYGHRSPVIPSTQEMPPTLISTFSTLHIKTHLLLRYQAPPK